MPIQRWLVRAGEAQSNAAADNESSDFLRCHRYCFLVIRVHRARRAGDCIGKILPQGGVHIVGVLEAFPQISRRVHAGKGHEIVDKVGLIKIAATAGDVSPVHSVAILYLNEDLLKAANATEELPREGDFAAKLLRS